MVGSSGRPHGPFTSNYGTQRAPGALAMGIPPWVSPGIADDPQGSRGGIPGIRGDPYPCVSPQSYPRDIRGPAGPHAHGSSGIHGYLRGTQSIPRGPRGSPGYPRDHPGPPRPQGVLAASPGDPRGRPAGGSPGPPRREGNLNINKKL